MKIKSRVAGFVLVTIIIVLFGLMLWLVYLTQADCETQLKWKAFSDPYGYCLKE